MDKLPNQPKPQFRGVLTPLFAFTLLEDGKISIAELVLMQIIDHYTEMKGVGCWASNVSLAKHLNLSVGHIKRLLANLTKMGLLIRKPSEDDRRVLIVNYPTGYNETLRCPRVAPTIPNRVAPMSPNIKDLKQNTVDHRKPNDRQIEKEDEFMDGITSNGFYHNSEVKRDQSKVKKPTKPIHHYFAKRLREALVKANVVNTYRQSSWAQEFRRLEESIQNDAIDQIDTVLTWYCDSVRKPYVPLAFSAKSFRTKFSTLQAAMTRATKDVPKDVEISKEAEDIFGRLKFLSWPKGTKDELKTVIQLSLERYTEFSRRYSAFLIKAKELDRNPSREKSLEKSLVRFYRFIQYEKIQTPITTVENWWRSVHSRISFDGWVGSSLVPHVWSTDHKLFKEEWEARAANYGNPKCFTMLIEELSK